MNGLIIGAVLMLVGGLLFIAAKRTKKVNISATNGSQAVGGNNSGIMLNMGSQPAPPQEPHSHWLTVVSIIVELIGMGVVVWHALHLARA